MVWDGRPKFPVGTISFEKSGPGGGGGDQGKKIVSRTKITGTRFQ